jgi:hypothetical protein
MTAGILFFGKDAGSLGMDDDEIDKAIDQRFDLLRGLGLMVAGSLVGTPTDTEVTFCVWKSDHTSMTLNQWAMLCEIYRESFPTYDGHIMMIDLTHHTTDMKKAYDALFAMLDTGINLDDLIG